MVRKQVHEGVIGGAYGGAKCVRCREHCVERSKVARYGDMKATG